jgi:hypothetical protein
MRDLSQGREKGETGKAYPGNPGEADQGRALVGVGRLADT